MRPNAVEALSVNLDGAEQVLVDRQRRPGQGRHRQQVGAIEHRLHPVEQRGAIEHGALVINPADIGGQCQLLVEGIAQLVLAIGGQLLEARAPYRMIDGAPDRLDVKTVAGKFLEFRAEVRESVEARLEGSGHVGADRTAGRRQAEQDLRVRADHLAGTARSTKSGTGMPIDQGSQASSPAIACIISAVSATVRVVGVT